MRSNRRYMVPEEALLQLLNGLTQPGSRIVMAPCFKLPPDAEVLSVHHNWDSRCFGFLVSHPSFSPVPQGEVAPSVAAELDGFEYLQLMPREESPQPTAIIETP